MATTFFFDTDPSLNGLRVGLVEALEVTWNSYSFEETFAAEILKFITSCGTTISSERKKSVRDMLRYGSYKPAGRAKPSSEYLAQAALEGEFPKVNFFVDAVNIVSLMTGYPMSIIDTDKAGSELLLKRGRAGDSYVFNAGGQTIDVSDLLCVYRRAEDSWVPTANPVRDSMATKIFEGAKNLLAIIYVPAGIEGAGVDDAVSQLASYLAAHAKTISVSVLECQSS